MIGGGALHAHPFASARSATTWDVYLIVAMGGETKRNAPADILDPMSSVTLTGAGLVREVVAEFIDDARERCQVLVSGPGDGAGRCC